MMRTRSSCALSVVVAIIAELLPSRALLGAEPIQVVIDCVLKSLPPSAHGQFVLD